MSLPTTGGTDRDTFGSAAAHSLPSLPRPPSYSILRSQIVANGISRKRSLSGESLPSEYVGSSIAVLTAQGLTNKAAALPSLRYQLPAQPPAKRLRRESLSPTSVGEVSDAKKLPPAKSTITTTPGAAQMQSILRGLQHLSSCSASGCSNPLCVSTRTFVSKVRAHRSNMTGKTSHDVSRCGACKLWGVIVRAHAPTCSEGALCRVPGCSSQ
ncbi:TAZ zinc finger [Phytophthora infestans]|uniref:TAZ zinc finger n=1 Tax=Phytophthora infestans TaxID=4787 RepID=A0A8S9TUW2_PHYIN|nr:TAZ zinc finger [Phytophthora infestans]